MLTQLVIILMVVGGLSYLVSARARTVEGFYFGTADSGSAPGMWQLVLSQVTTWIFARSLLNAGILGYFFGIAGVLAYAAYYLSFLTGAAIVDSLRFRHGYGSVQAFLHDRFGSVGTGCFNFVVALRLASEVFANLLVIGILFGQTGTLAYGLSILAVAGLALGYSLLGGLRASLRTDVFQALALIAVLAVLLAQLLTTSGYAFTDTLASSPDPRGAGWVLLVVALLQVLSYPLHDPVMMDRGFLADRRTTRQSFLHACWISLVLIVAFGLLGVHAGLHRFDGEELTVTLERLMGPSTMLLVNIALVLSAISTLDSTLSSAAKLTVVDMKLARPSLRNGRVAMILFMLLGLGLLFLGSDDLFSAVALSGTASMFLAPVILFSLWGGWNVARWAYLVAFAAAMAGSLLFFLESAGHIGWMAAASGLGHSYSHLLLICIAVLVIGCGAFVLGRKPGLAATAPGRPGS